MTLRSLLREITLNTRGLTRHPGYTATMVLILTLGIGGTGTIYSIVDSFLLRPLPLPAADRLVQLSASNPAEGISGMKISVPNFRDLRERGRAFASLEGYLYRQFNISIGAAPEIVLGAPVTEGVFRLLGVAPLLGRDFRPGEGGRGQAPAAILSYPMWQKRFGGSPEVVGRLVRLDGRATTIIAVMPPGFDFPLKEVGVWTPLGLDRPDLVRDKPLLLGVGRLAPGVSLRQAQAQMSTFMAELRRTYPQENAGLDTRVVPLRDALLFDFTVIRIVLIAVAVATTLLFLVVCGNAANLSLARNLGRSREFAIRTAIGASKSRLLRLFAVEAGLLSLAGALAGALLTEWLNRWADARIPALLYRVGPLSIDGRVALLLAATAGVATLVIALLPFFYTLKLRVVDTLKESAATSSAGLRHRRLASALVVGQISLGLLLLVGSGLVADSLWRMQTAETGLQPERVAAFEMTLPSGKYQRPEQLRTFYREALRRCAALPGIEAVALVDPLPLNGESDDLTFAIPGRGNTSGQPRSAGLYHVTPDYFRVMGIPLLAGRAFPALDDAAMAGEAIVNRSFAERFLASGRAAGGSIELEPGPRRRIAGVLGVVADTRDLDVWATPQPELFLPLMQEPTAGFRLVARSTGDPAGSLAEIRSALWAAEPDLAITSSRTMRQVIARSLTPQRIAAVLLVVLSLCALGLAVCGLYGVVSMAAHQRIPEIGIRMALGAKRGDLLRLLLGQGFRLSVIGVAIGLGAGIAVGRLLRSALYGIGAGDLLGTILLGLLFLVIAMVVSYLPLRKPTRLEPLNALRR
jgi:putative ABC transport system permease protein